jgi:DNA-binding beta-propeller fold protein YncE
MKKKILPILLCIMFLAWMIPVGTAQAASSWTNITGSGVFNHPYGVAVDSSGNVYVTDFGNNKIKELTNGSWTDIAGSGVPSHPYGVAVDSSGNVYVTDYVNNKIKELTHGAWTDITYSEGFSGPYVLLPA